MAQQVASYYAGVKIDFDRKSLESTTRYIKKIQTIIERFKAQVEKNTNIKLRIRVDRGALVKSLNTNMQRVANAVTFPLKRFTINIKGLERAMTLAAQNGRFIRVNALLSPTSLKNMREQVRRALGREIISPTIRARASVSGGASQAVGGSSSRRNPYHNPMLLGGAAGAMMRFGPYALPFVGGAYGLNAMGNITQELQSNRILLGAVSQGSTHTGAENQAFLEALGGQLGITTRTMTPHFVQMLAASRGTSLEGGLQTGFKSFMQYAAGMNLSEYKMDRSLYAIVQMIGKGKMGA